MEKEFVPYEQALALKELGFDEPCLTYYNYDKRIERSDDWAYGCTLEDKRDRNQCLAPLYQQSFRWFREKYNLDKVIDSWTEQPMDGEIWDKAYQYYANGEAFHPYFKTYEEAELECLIKLIDIVKEKK